MNNNSKQERPTNLRDAHIEKFNRVLKGAETIAAENKKYAPSVSANDSTDNFLTAVSPRLSDAHGVCWLEIIWPRPFEIETAQEAIAHLATIGRRGSLVFEIRARRGRLRYLLGAQPESLNRIMSLLQSEISGIRFTKCAGRARVSFAGVVKASHPRLSLNIGNTLSMIRSTLASFAQVKYDDDEVVLQIMLGRAYTPSLLPSKLSDPQASWLDVLRGTISPATSESRRLLHEKVNYHGFDTVIRIGAITEDKSRAFGYIQGVLSGLKVAESAGTRLKTVSERASAIDEAHCPWRFPMKLSVRELIGFLCWPLGEGELPGVAGLHPRVVYPPAWLKHSERCFAMSAPNEIRLGIPAKDSLEHTVILGPTGSGKSNVMLSLILADINAGRSVLVIDPKADLIHDILERIPSERENDVVVLDPSDPCPVGFNPLASGRNPTLTADAILAVFRDIFADSWGIRTQDILSGALLTLAQTKGASLVWLPALLTDERFRRSITKNITDKVGLGSFWAGFEEMSNAERNQAIAPVMNKIRNFLLRPQLRAMLAQSEPKFSLTDIFYKRRIILVPLNKGLVGHESARLLGSLIVGQLWTLALSRAEIAPERRHIVNVFIDEVQDYLSLPTDLSDALSQARGLGVSLTLAHQYRSQLPPTLRAGIDANARNKIVFGLSASDAKDMAAMAPELKAEDFMLLPRYHTYVLLMSGGKSTGWVWGRTLSPTPQVRPAHEIKAVSMAAYGRNIEEVEQEYLSVLGLRDDKKGGLDEPIGRKKRELKDEKDDK